jgi:flavin reductase (DIM6/NTAB) family NADH-FMN oxidoreductase RutF
VSSNPAPDVSDAAYPFRFRRACARYATGIAIVTATGADGLAHGMTINSFTSVSLDPPLVLVCVDNRATILPHLLGAETLAISVLDENHRELSGRFARRGEERFTTAEWKSGVAGDPLLIEALATFECDIRSVVETGDHQVFIAEAKHVHWREGRPLLYFDSAYHTLPEAP